MERKRRQRGPRPLGLAIDVGTRSSGMSCSLSRWYHGHAWHSVPLPLFSWEYYQLNPLARRCRYHLNHSNGKCDQCHEASTTCESLAPAKIDKRRLQVMLDRAVTDEDRQRLAEMVAERGVYLPKAPLQRQSATASEGASRRKRRRISEKSGDESRGRLETGSERSSMEAHSTSVSISQTPSFPSITAAPQYAGNYDYPVDPTPSIGHLPSHPETLGKPNPQAGPSRLPYLDQEHLYPGVTTEPDVEHIKEETGTPIPAHTMLKTSGVEPRLL